MQIINYQVNVNQPQQILSYTSFRRIFTSYFVGVNSSQQTSFSFRLSESPTVDRYPFTQYIYHMHLFNFTKRYSSPIPTHATECIPITDPIKHTACSQASHYVLLSMYCLYSKLNPTKRIDIQDKV